MPNNKNLVHDFWNRSSCGEDLYLNSGSSHSYERQAIERYTLEPYILEFAKFKLTCGQRVLEIGVGLGADHQKFAESGAILFGIDLTERAISHTQRRLDYIGLSSNLSICDAEQLNYPANFFDVVYSWGVLHHSPDTATAVSEVFRVLKNGGVARLMIYNKFSIVGFMLWVRYALFLGRPWRSIEYIYANFLESPGTKAFTKNEAMKLFKDFSSVSIQTVLTHGDLLTSEVGQRHRGILLSFARKIIPRNLIKKYFQWAGLFMLIEAHK